MGKILQQLYRGDLCPAENTIRGNAEYDALTRQSMDDFNRFTDKLDRDMKEEFDLLMEHYLELTFIEKTQCFTDGFRIGAGVMCEVFYENAAKMGISLENLGALLISHAHYDHAGGVKRLIEEETIRKIYVGKDFFQGKYYEKNDGTMKDIGIAFSKEELEKKGITVCEVKEDMQMIFPGVTLYRNFERIVGYEQLNPRFFVKKEDKEIVADCFAESFFQTHSGTEEGMTAYSTDCSSDELSVKPTIEKVISEYTKDSFTDEIAVALDTEQGIVVIVGCSHPGIMNILRTIEKRSGKKICGVVGGTHLMEADGERLRKTIDDLKEMNINFIAVSHCTGEDNLETIKNNFGEKFIFNCTGNVIRF